MTNERVMIAALDVYAAACMKLGEVYGTAADGEVAVQVVRARARLVALLRAALAAPQEEMCSCPPDDHWDCQGTGLANGGRGSLAPGAVPAAPSPGSGEGAP